VHNLSKYIELVSAQVMQSDRRYCTTLYLVCRVLIVSYEIEECKAIRAARTASTYRVKVNTP
jgi:hypothetical protein